MVGGSFLVSLIRGLQFSYVSVISLLCLLSVFFCSVLFFPGGRFYLNLLVGGADLRFYFRVLY